MFDNATRKPELELTTRIMHIRSVAELARKIAIELGLDYEEQIMAEIMGHAHDIGHTPFGHKGETILNNEIKQFGTEYNFKHQEYGANVFDEIYNRFLKTFNNLGGEIDEEYVNKLRAIIKEGIINHNQYYAYKVEKENMPQKCVRIADFIAFMISDVSDLLRYKDLNGKSIISKKEIIEKIDSDTIEKLGQTKIMEMLQVLEKGGPELVRLHSDIVKEIVGSASSRGDIMTMTDKYKILKDMQDACDLNDKEQVLNTIIVYNEYLMQTGKNEKKDEEFIEKISQQIRYQREESVLERLRNLSIEDEESIDIICELARKVARDDIKEVLESEIKNAPQLTSLFIIQKQQYADIVLHDAILGNEQNEEKVIEIFNKILKSAYYIKSRGDDKSSRLKEYMGKVVPKLSEKRYEPLEYAVFVIQQMTNEDFERKDFIRKILGELGVTEAEMELVDKIDMNDIYEEAKREKIEMKETYLPENIKSLTQKDSSINSDTVPVQSKSEKARIK